MAEGAEVGVAVGLGSLIGDAVGEAVRVAVAVAVGAAVGVLAAVVGEGLGWPGVAAVQAVRTRSEATARIGQALNRDIISASQPSRPCSVRYVDTHSPVSDTAPTSGASARLPGMRQLIGRQLTEVDVG